MSLPSRPPRPFRRVPNLLVLIPLAACASGSSEPPTAAPVAGPASSVAAPASLADGAYTVEQAARGAEAFRSVCGECHAVREFRGTDFFFNWEGATVGRFVDLVAETMPEDDPGGLPMEQYLAITAYILELNGYPAGAAPLPAEAEVLAGLTFERPGDPAPVPAGPKR